MPTDKMAPDTVGNIINSLGFGKFSVGIIITLGVLWISDASELNLISILGPELRCQWHLSSLQTSITSVTVFLGQGFGTIYWGYLSDIHGRKNILAAGSLMTVYFGLLSSISPNYIWYVIIRFFVGFGVGCAIFATSYIAEFMVQQHRGKSILSLDLFYAFGSLYIACISLLLMQTVGWRIFLIVATIPSAFFFCISFWLPESVQFLQNTGEYDKIVKTLNRISRMNNVPVKSSPVLECRQSSKRGNISLLFSKQYLSKMVICVVIAVSTMCSYYGIVMLNTEFLQMGSTCQQDVTVATKTIGCHRLDNGDYLQNMVVTAAEFPGVLMFLLLIDRIGRKTCMVPGLVITGLGFLCLNFCFLRHSVVFMFLIRMLLIAVSQMPAVFAAELFPTVVRTSALGILVGSTRFVCIGVPFLVQSLVHKSVVATTVIFAVPCFISAVLVLFLPETRNIELPNI